MHLQRGLAAAQEEAKFSEAERLTEEARRAAREAHLRAEEALQKQRAAEEAERAAQQLRAKHDQEAQQLSALRAKVGDAPTNHTSPHVWSIDLQRKIWPCGPRCGRLLQGMLYLKFGSSQLQARPGGSPAGCPASQGAASPYRARHSSVELAMLAKPEWPQFTEKEDHQCMAPARQGAGALCNACRGKPCALKYCQCQRAV